MSIFLPGKDQGQRSLVCSSSSGFEESGMTEHCVHREESGKGASGPGVQSSLHLGGLGTSLCVF